MAFKQESVDPLDLESYIDFDQAVVYPSPSSSASSAVSRGKAIATPEFSIPAPSSVLLPPSQPTFSGPSHQYDSYKQQTGLPVGALAKTLAVNQANNFQYGSFNQNFGMSSSDNNYFGMNSIPEDFDFNSFNAPSFGSSTDMDMDFDSPVSDLFSSTSGPQLLTAAFVDPNAIGGKEDSSPPASLPSNNGRLWPGMHQQLAKEQQRQQQQQRAMQQPQNNNAQRQGQRPAGNQNRTPADPLVEERISRLLNQMRHSSVSSSQDDMVNNGNGGSSHLARQKKDEEDMDEDERLLASEEGKKLSSKERRQLRNKVSARAFRSRRKEYIGQLEGELSAKGQEADDLRAENEALKTENTRLTDLTRMLLQSPAFSTFLTELSSNPTAAPVAPATLPTQPSTNNQARKDANPHQQRQMQQPGDAHVGMTFMPETTLDFSTIEPVNSSWGTGMDFGFNAQVFAVTELPEGPVVDASLLSGKTTNFLPTFASDSAKTELPTIERMPEVETVSEPVVAVEDVDFDESDPAFALFVDAPITAAKSSEPEVQLFGGVRLEKAFARLDLVVGGDNADESSNGEEIGAALMARFQGICSCLDDAAARLAAVTAHLS